MGHDGSSESSHRVQSQSPRLGFITTVAYEEEGILSPTLIWCSPGKSLRRRMGARPRWAKTAVSSEDEPVDLASDEDGWDPSLELVRRARAREAGWRRDREVGSRASPARKASRGGEGKKRSRSRGKKGKQKDGEELQIVRF